MIPLLIGICIIIILIIGIRLLRYINDGFWWSYSSGCTRLLLVIAGVLAIIFIINLVSPILAPAPDPVVTPPSSLSDSSDAEESAPNLLLPFICCLVVLAVGTTLGIYYYRQQVGTANLPISNTNDTKKKNDSSLVGDDGEFVVNVELNKSKSTDEPNLSFTGKGKTKTVTREFDLAKGMYRVDYKAPNGTWLTVGIVDLASGTSNYVLHMEREVGSTTYNNKNAGRFVLEIEHGDQSRDQWSVNLSSLK